MRRMAPGARNEMPDVIVTAPLPSPPFARCPNITPVGTRAALRDATIWLRFALLPRSGRHRLLEVIMPASTPRLQSPCPLPRRAFLSAAAAAAGGLALACVDRATGVAMLPPLTASRLPDPGASGIEHVVLVMMENRSFDHFLGWLPGANGRQAGLTYIDSAGTGHATYPLAPDFQGCGHVDPDHSYEGGRVEYDGGACDGWLRVNDIFSIGYYQGDDLPFLGRAVLQWASFDRYFCAIMAPTFPNRMYQHAGQTRSEEHTSELQSHVNLVCRLLLEKKKKKNIKFLYIQKKTQYPKNIKQLNI